MSDGHMLIVGLTLSGKSTLAKALSEKYTAAGIQCIVLDHMRDPGWHAAHVFDEPNDFLDYVTDPDLCQGCALFVDEGGLNLDRYDKRYQWLTTTSRHHGHRTHIISQRAESIDRTTRSQCTTLAAFALPPKDCKMYASDFNCPEVLHCASFPQGQYVYKRGFSAAQIRRMF